MLLLIPQPRQNLLAIHFPQRQHLVRRSSPRAKVRVAPQLTRLAHPSLPLANILFLSVPALVFSILIHPDLCLLLQLTASLLVM